jgi:hypothetical protein
MEILIAFILYSVLCFAVARWKPLLGVVMIVGGVVLTGMAVVASFARLGGL